MHVPIAKPGDQIAPSAIDHLGRGADAMAGIRPNIGKAPIGHGDLPAVKHLSALDIDQTDIADNQIGGIAASGDGNKAGGGFSPSRNMM